MNQVDELSYWAFDKGNAVWYQYIDLQQQKIPQLDA